MVTSAQAPVGKLQHASQPRIRETVLAPRFYTTDFDAAAEMDLSSQRAELEAMLEEMQTDYNRYHFVRDREFEQSWEHIDDETRAAFVDFLERSCSSEFSGFLLFKEMSRKLKQRNPLLSDILNLMARDEARHAAFLNKTMGDFNLAFDLPHLSKSRSYTYFPLPWVLYTVYLSEKIGYWRYITIYRHLEAQPDRRFHPLFKYFKNWCQDENRHGDIFKALVRSQPRLWNNWRARLWVRFFLLSVFATHTLTVHERAEFYESLGLDPTEYDREVIRQTNNTAKGAFPVVLDTDHPEFFQRLHRCSNLNLKMQQIDASKLPPGLKTLRKLPLIASSLWQILRLYAIAPIDCESLRGTVS
ncbi:magnesium-protoporphyrin IX monomethyl ester (oxidative) cyclase [Synechococcus sp. PCC 7336]|uniref:magnesium-protoporphyrin IX monomethyl ester (oxidative) cyclase n=1 Tax=Synechococcus sp. PCC 7336 TaxID=195250 RepID=UPI00036BE63D|nr:magnesium-protoporphyrin IX monomethyl ester (oxidative) cyclase [Synechococcus sp. PCC 7336]